MGTIADVQYVEFEESRLAFRKFGNGAAPLLAFHGFGQNGGAFAAMQGLPDDAFTTYAIDLFFQGNSQYGGNRPVTKTYWQRLIAAFLRAQGIGRFSLIGFSLGGRFALTVFEAFADRIDQLILLAPDGITYSPVYRLATRRGVGRLLFRYGLRHRSLLTRAGHALTRLGLLSRTAMRFAEISLSTPEQRELVYITWTQFRDISPDLSLIGNLLTTNSVRVRFFTGAFDQIVPGSYILPLTKRLRQYELTVLKTGHTQLIERVVPQLTQRPLHNQPQPNDRHHNESDNEYLR